jgi:hypothetical protein
MYGLLLLPRYEVTLDSAATSGVTGGGVGLLTSNPFVEVTLSYESGTVPTPATLALFGLGLAGLGWSRLKKA